MDEDATFGPQVATKDETIDEGGSENEDVELEDEMDDDHCSICLQLFTDRAILPDCAHEFCFECIITWTEQSRRCPLCTRTIGSYVIHNVRSKYDFQKHHLVPLRSSPPPIQPLQRSGLSTGRRRNVRPRPWGRRRETSNDTADAFERAVDKRRWVYHNHLYAKHVASNSFTRYRPCPSPEQFSKSPDLISRATIFIRRELQVWVNLDVEFLTTFIISLLKAIDIRSESSVKLLAEFLDMDRPYSEFLRFPNAEHFAHELYSYLRSPFKSLSAYDAYVQYGNPAEASNNNERRQREDSSRRTEVRNRPRRASNYDEGVPRREETRRRETERETQENEEAGPSMIPEPPRQSESDVGRLNRREKILDAVQRRLQPEPRSSTSSIQLSSFDTDADNKEKGRALDPGSDMKGSPHDSESHSIFDNALPFSVDIQSSSVIPMERTSDPVSTLENCVAAPALNETTTTSSNKFAPNEEKSGSQTKPASTSSKSTRIRQPLLLAQAHLSKAGTSRRIAEDSSASNVKSEGPPLLSRIALAPGSDDVHGSDESRSGLAIQLIGHSAPPTPVSDVGVRSGPGGPAAPPQNGGVTVLSMREVLMKRLEQAKAERSASETTTTTPIATSLTVTEQNDQLTNDGDEDDTRVDAVASEHKLRLQAHLRAKLANERKRVAPSAGPDQNSGTQGDVDSAIESSFSSVGMDADLRETGREAALKAMLGRRKKIQP